MGPDSDQRPVSASADAGETTASVSYHLPAEALSGAVTTYYLVRVSGPGTVRDQIFPEWPNFRLILSGAWTAQVADADPAPVPADGVTGTLERAVWVEASAGLMVGVVLTPQGWPRLTAAPADGFANRMRPMADAIGPASDELHARLKAVGGRGEESEAAIFEVLDEVLGAMLTEAPEAALVAAAHAALQDPLVQTVTDWAEAFGHSPRQLERFSQRYFGLPPKRLLRRQRLLRTLAAMREGGGTWSQALDGQFADQAHFIHEFNYYMGTTPKAYLARPQPIMAEAWKRRKALLGSPVQALQPPAQPAS